MKPRIAILASGSGTTAEAFIRADHAGEIAVDVGLVIVSREDAGVFGRISHLNQEFGLSIKTELVNRHTHPDEEQAIMDLLTAGNYDLVALMGYMKKIGPRLVKEFGWLPQYKSIYQAMMVNTHPGILPDTRAFYGLNIQKYVLDHHLPYAGQTLHVVSAEYDAGPIIAEHKVEVLPDDTADSLFARVQTVEKQYLPKDIEDFIKARRAFLETGGV